MAEQSTSPRLVARLRRTARSLGSKAHFFLFVLPLGTIARRFVRPRLPREADAALCDLILAEAVASGAQELHLAAGAVRVHRQDIWVEMMRMPLAVHTPLVSRLKTMAHLDPGVHATQEGELRVTAWGREVVGVLTIERMPDATEEARVRFPPVSGVSPH